MIGVTKRAKERLKEILSANVDNPEAGLRLTLNEAGQLGLGVDIEVKGDEVVEHEGSKVLMVEKELAGRLVGLTIDVEDTAEGAQLVIVGEPKGQ